MGHGRSPLTERCKKAARAAAGGRPDGTIFRTIDVCIAAFDLRAVSDTQRQAAVRTATPPSRWSSASASTGRRASACSRSTSASRAPRSPGVVELLPTFRSLMVHYDPLRTSRAELARRIEPLARRARGRCARRPAAGRIPVCYDPAFALDLEEVATRTGLAPAEVVEHHSATIYHVYMIGFLPGYPYMGDLPGAPRAAPPRESAHAGAGRVGGDRDHHDGRLHAAEPGRLAHPRPHAGVAVEPAPHAARACSRPATRCASRRSRMDEFDRLAQQADAGELDARGAGRMTERAAGRRVQLDRACSRTSGGTGSSATAFRCPARSTRVSLRIANAVVGNPDGTAALEMFYRGPTLEVGPRACVSRRSAPRWK